MRRVVFAFLLGLLLAPPSSGEQAYEFVEIENADGNPVYYEDELGHAITFEYDDEARRVYITQENGVVTAFPMPPEEESE